jgi:hypothetical protein
LTGLRENRKVKIFDYPKFVQPFREVRENAGCLEAEQG